MDLESLLPRTSYRSSNSFHTFSSYESCVNRNRNHLDCRVCEEAFRSTGDAVPRLLQCGHTLCHACLLRLPVTDHALVCPFDRHATPLGQGGVHSLAKNFALLELLEDDQERRESEVEGWLSAELLAQLTLPPPSIPCDEDPSHPASLYCTVCSSHLCLPCSEASHSPRSLASHRRVPLKDKPREKPRCAAHPSHAVEFACLEPDCAARPLLCVICRDYTHAKHKHALLEAEAGAVRGRLGGGCEAGRRAVGRLSSALARLERQARQLEDCPEADLSSGPPPALPAARDAISAHFAAQRAALQLQETAALAALDSHVRERRTSLAARRDRVASVLAELAQAVTEAQRCQRHDDGRLLTAGRPLADRLSRLLSCQLPADVELDCEEEEPQSIPFTFTKDNRIHLGPLLEMRLVALGLDGAGKTTILSRLQGGATPAAPPAPPCPTIGFNVETVLFKNFKFTVWDVGGAPKLRPLWRHYYYNTQAVVFVVDASCGARLAEAATEVGRLMGAQELRGAPLLVYANQRGDDACDVSVALSLGAACAGRPWHVAPCDAASGRGLSLGLEWLALQLGP